MMYNENDSASSKDIHILLLLSGIFFLLNLFHSDPGFASSLKYSFGRELYTQKFFNYIINF